MKKIIMLFFVTALLLVGCSNGESESVDAEPNEKETNDVEKVEGSIEKVEDDKVEKDESEGGLTKVGQVIKEAQYSVELLKTKDINETLNHGPLSLHLFDAKLIKMFDMSNGIKNDFQFYTTDEVTDEITYIQLQYKINNTSEEDLSWYRIENIVTNTGKQVDGNNDFLSREFVYDVFSGVEVDYLNGYIVDENTDEFRLIFSPVYEYDGYEISDGIEYEFSFSE